MTPRPVSFAKLRVNQKIRHANGTSYLIVRVVEAGRGELPEVYARWRNGQIGRYGKEVVRLTPAHVRGFLRHRPRTHPAHPLADRRAPEAQPPAEAEES